MTNPLKGNQREQLKRLSCDDAGRKIDELVNAFNEMNERIEFLEVKKENSYFTGDLPDGWSKTGYTASYGDDIELEKAFKRAVKGANRLQQIQDIVWDYMETPKNKRNGVDMAMEISKLFE